MTNQFFHVNFPCQGKPKHFRHTVIGWSDCWHYLFKTGGNDCRLHHACKIHNWMFSKWVGTIIIEVSQQNNYLHHFLDWVGSQQEPCMMTPGRKHAWWHRDESLHEAHFFGVTMSMRGSIVHAWMADGRTFRVSTKIVIPVLAVILEQIFKQKVLRRRNSSVISFESKRTKCVREVI